MNVTCLVCIIFCDLIPVFGSVAETLDQLLDPLLLTHTL